MFKKNDVVNLTIEDMSVNGEGIGHADGMAFFVKDAVVGDRIVAGVTKVKKSFCYARIIEIKNESPYRSMSKCDMSKRCGGCQLQALSYEKQLELKSSHVRNNLIRIGGFSEEEIDNIIEPIIGMDEPYYYRNKIQYPVRIDRNGEVQVGFYQARSHDIVPIKQCFLSKPISDEVVGIVKEWIVNESISVYDEKNNTGDIRHILVRYGFNSKEIMVSLVVNNDIADIKKSIDESTKRGKKWKKLIDELSVIEGMTSIVINENVKNTNVILGEKTVCIYGREYIKDSIGGVEFNISANSFYQVNPIQTENLYGKALEYASLTGEENVWDLYCGIGTISLFLSKNAKSVFGVEVVPQAIEDALGNARENDIRNASFVVGKAEEIIREIEWEDTPKGVSRQGVLKYNGNKENVAYPDVIVVDPPRKGCDEDCLNTMLELEPDRIVYVSCNPSTLARDLKILCEKKYTLEAVTPVDMFPQSSHVETICSLHRNR